MESKQLAGLVLQHAVMCTQDTEGKKGNRQTARGALTSGVARLAPKTLSCPRFSVLFTHEGAIFPWAGLITGSALRCRNLCLGPLDGPSEAVEICWALPPRGDQREPTKSGEQGESPQQIFAGRAHRCSCLPVGSNAVPALVADLARSSCLLFMPTNFLPWFSLLCGLRVVVQLLS